MQRIRHLAVGTAAVVAAIAIGDATPTQADDGIRTFATILVGATEVPGPGDPDGIGVAGVLVNVNQEKVCYVIAVRRIAPATLAHIHQAPAGVAGPIVVHLDPPTRGFSADCVDVDGELAAAIAAEPEQYYVNVHNADFPAGAVRGQLR